VQNQQEQEAVALDRAALNRQMVKAVQESKNPVQAQMEAQHAVLALYSAHPDIAQRLIAPDKSELESAPYTSNTFTPKHHSDRAEVSNVAGAEVSNVAGAEVSNVAGAEVSNVAGAEVNATSNIEIELASSATDTDRVNITAFANEKPFDSIGNYLLHLRQLRGDSRNKIARAINSNSSTIKAYEENMRTVTWQMAERLASVLDADWTIMSPLVMVQFTSSSQSSQRCPTRIQQSYKICLPEPLTCDTKTVENEICSAEVIGVSTNIIAEQATSCASPRTDTLASTLPRLCWEDSHYRVVQVKSSHDASHASISAYVLEHEDGQDSMNATRWYPCELVEDRLAALDYLIEKLADSEALGVANMVAQANSVLPHGRL